MFWSASCALAGALITAKASSVDLCTADMSFHRRSLAKFESEYLYEWRLKGQCLLFWVRPKGPLKSSWKDLLKGRSCPEKSKRKKKNGQIWAKKLIKAKSVFYFCFVLWLDKTDHTQLILIIITIFVIPFLYPFS